MEILGNKVKNFQCLRTGGVDLVIFLLWKSCSDSGGAAPLERLFRVEHPIEAMVVDSVESLTVKTALSSDGCRFRCKFHL